MQSETKVCQNCKKDFTIEPDDFAFYEKIKVPAPTFCPECRFQRRMGWRNERSFFHSTCKKCGKKGITVYPPESEIKVYCRPCWWSDNWDGLEYGADFDKSRPFFEQLRDLLSKVPLPDLFGLYTTLDNSEYTNMVGYLKNCYFITMADWDENCAFGSFVYNCKDSYDSLNLTESELCYETVNCRQCYKTIFSIDCESCQNVSFSKNCVGCSDCIGCINLKNKQYYILNKQYTKEDYFKEAEQYRPTSRRCIQETMAKVEKFFLNFPHKYIHEHLTNNVSGDYINNAKNVHNSFIVHDMENARYCSLVLPGKTTEAYDHTHYGGSTELLYETLQVGNQASRITYSWFVITGVENVSYSMWAIGCKNVFGCVGLKKREYCILNKQYTKEEYEKLKTEIIKQMDEAPYIDKNGIVYRYGEFFPLEMSPFPYNVSSAQEEIPLTKEMAKEKGYKWHNREKSSNLITIAPGEIFDDADSIPQDITKEVLGCAHENNCDHQCSTAFKVTKDELAFYKKINLPLPDLCPNCRHYKRLQQRNPMKLWDRKCAKCGKDIKTSYALDRPEIVYCEQCYNQEVV